MLGRRAVSQWMSALETLEQDIRGRKNEHLFGTSHEVLNGFSSFSLSIYVTKSGKFIVIFQMADRKIRAPKPHIYIAFRSNFSPDLFYSNSWQRKCNVMSPSEKNEREKRIKANGDQELWPLFHHVPSPKQVQRRPAVAADCRKMENKNIAFPNSGFHFQSFVRKLCVQPVNPYSSGSRAIAIAFCLFWRLNFDCPSSAIRTCRLGHVKWCIFCRCHSFGIREGKKCISRCLPKLSLWLFTRW